MNLLPTSPNIFKFSILLNFIFETHFFAGTVVVIGQFY